MDEGEAVSFKYVALRGYPCSSRWSYTQVHMATPSRLSELEKEHRKLKGKSGGGGGRNREGN